MSFKVEIGTKIPFLRIPSPKQNLNSQFQVSKFGFSSNKQYKLKILITLTFFFFGLSINSPKVTLKNQTKTNSIKLKTKPVREGHWKFETGTEKPQSVEKAC